VIQFLAVAFSLLFASCAWLGHEAETCTMGDTDGFVLSVIYAIPFVALALTAFWFARDLSGRQAMAAPLIVLPVFAAVLFIMVPWAYSTLYLGHHLCGPEYDDYLPYSSPSDRFVPVVHIVFLVAIGFASTLPWFRRAA
jgi:hypothetical protein